EVKKYWNTTYRIEALITLKNMLDNTMKTETFKKVTQPVLLCYYYKNEEEQDKIVSVSAMLKMFGELGTPPELKRKVALPKTGAHALASGLNSKDLTSVEIETSRFLEEILKIKNQY
ncbi:MAG: alpha/beta hydrolase, partial [Opitutaceae bacterium]|nr:alpha/beta hydrolase [Cytophagales bacterium]